MVSNDLIARLSDYEIDPGDVPLPDAIVEASEKIAAIYAGLLGRGVDDEVVARTMMGAMISFYDAMGMAPVLPTLLRIVADKVEAQIPLN